MFCALISVLKIVSFLNLNTNVQFAMVGEVGVV